MEDTKNLNAENLACTRNLSNGGQVDAFTSLDSKYRKDIRNKMEMSS